MSVEKLDFVRSRTEKIRFGIINFDVIQKLKNEAAFIIWVYLSSRPGNWKVNKSELRSHFNMGLNRLNNALAYLKKSNLIRYEQLKDDKGSFMGSELVVLAGYDFIDLEEVKSAENISAPVHMEIVDSRQIAPNCAKSRQSNIIKNRDLEKSKPAYMISEHSGSHASENGILNNIDNINNNKKRNIKIYCANEEFARATFEAFYKIYPKKRDRDKAWYVWLKCKLWEIANIILSDVNRRICADGQWQEHQFIPYPATYLRNRRWADEVVPATVKKIPEVISVKRASDVVADILGMR